MTKNHHRLVGLEFIRFAMAVVVLIYHHAHFFIGVGVSVERLPGVLPFYSVLRPIYVHGLMAVNVFWALSGFIFFHNYAERIAERRVRGFEFAALRFSRLYPLHFVTLVVVAILQAIFWRLHGHYFVYPVNDVQRFLLHLGFASDWVKTAEFSFNGPVWSVSVEVLVYAIFFALMRTAGARVWVALTAVVVGGVLSRVPQPFVRVGLCVFYFFLGGCVQHLYVASAGVRRRWGQWWVAGWAALIVVVIAGAILVPRLQNPAVLVIALVGPVILLSLEVGQGLSARVEGVVVACGNLTYASYLIHFPLQLGLTTVVLGVTGSAEGLHARWVLPAFVVGTLVVSRGVFLFFEWPVQRELRGVLVGGR